MFLDHTQRRTTVCRTPLDKWSVRRRDLYLTAHNTHNRQISMPTVGFEPTISAGERTQTYALDRAATGTGFMSIYCLNLLLQKYFYILQISKSFLQNTDFYTHSWCRSDDIPRVIFQRLALTKMNKADTGIAMRTDVLYTRKDSGSDKESCFFFWRMTQKRQTQAKLHIS